MQNSPKSVYKHEMSAAYDSNHCDERFNGSEEVTLHCTIYDPDNAILPGVVEYRVVQRVSLDGAATFLADVYTQIDGTEETIIFLLEVDDQEYWLIREQPYPVEKEF